MLYLIFFLSGVSGLIYQVIWIRVFGNVFGNTIYSASLVVSVFMLGLGVGSYLAGAWADRRYAAGPASLLGVYGYVELIIGAMGLVISVLLPHLDRVSAMVSSYSRQPNGWYVLSASSHAARAAMAIALLAPITLLMGATLTLLIRHLVRSDVEAGRARIATLYAVNTAGAAAGAFLTDFALVPGFGIRATQYVAVSLNALAGLGALAIADRGLRIADSLSIPDARSAVRNKSAIRNKSTIFNKSAIRNPQSAMSTRIAKPPSDRCAWRAAPADSSRRARRARARRARRRTSRRRSGSRRRACSR